MEPVRLIIKTVPTQEEIDAFKKALDNCYVETADAEATENLAKMMGVDIETLDNQLSTLGALEK